MTAAGFPTDPERRDGENQGSGEPPADDWNAQFTAIVSGISGSMRWETGADQSADSPERRDPAYPRAEPADLGSHDGDRYDGDRYDTDWYDDDTDTAESRRLRRELRRQERSEELAAHLQAQADAEAEMAADEEHFVPPPPPPLPRLRRRTVGALLLIVTGILLLSWPALLPASTDLIVVLALLLIMGGAGILVAGMRRHRGEPGEGWDDGAEV